MGLELAKAYIRVEVDNSGLDSGLKTTQSRTGGMLSKIGGFAKGALVAGIGTATAGLAGFVAVASDAVGEAQRSQDSYARLAAVLKATGNAAGFSTDQLTAYAGELEAASTISDDEIMESMAVLGTFKSVSGDVFKSATKAAMDLSATGFGSMESASVMLGKALEDPAHGISALTRVGVTFSEEQKKQIKQFMEMNQLGKAQAVILAAVEGQVGGTAEALAKTDSGKMKQLENTLGNIKEELGAAVMPLFIKFKELQIVVMQRIVDVVKWIRVLSDNSGVTWDLMKTQVMLFISRSMDFFKNFFFAIPEMALAAVKGMWEAFKGFFELMGSALKGLLTLFKTTFQAIEDFWLNVFTGEGFQESFSKAMTTIGDEIKRTTADQLKKAGQVGSRVANVMSKEMEGVDLFATSEATKTLEDERAKLAQVLGEARAAMDVQQTESEQAAKKEVAAAGPKQTQIEAGRVGFADFGKRLQEAILKEGDGNEKVMISLLEAGNKIQEAQLKAIKESKPVGNLGLVEGNS